MAPIPDTLDALRAKLASLQAQAVDARAELARLRVDLAHARMQLDGDAIHRLLVSNEQLVMDAMRSRDMVESTALLMSELSRCSELDSHVRAMRSAWPRSSKFTSSTRRRN